MVKTGITEEIIETYLKRTPVSKEHDLKAKGALPGGDTRWSTYYMPYPIYMDRGQGCRLVDVDGNTYIDVQNNYTALVHGHRHPEIMKAVEKYLAKDILFGAPSESQYLLADLVTRRLPGVDLLRFTNSGTEAAMMAMRTARAFMKRDIIIKMDGGYHGSHDLAEVNISPDPRRSNPPEARVETDGVPGCVLDAVRVARFNDTGSVESVLKQYADRTAAIVVEPVMNSAGIIPATVEFLRDLRTLADRYGVLLIFDEIVTFRLHEQGLQGKYGVVPDLTALGKLIGGGFAMGAFGGRKDIMSSFDPAAADGFHHSGTFNGHNLMAAAGAAAVRMLDQAAIDRIDRLGERLVTGLQRVTARYGIREAITRAGSLLYLHWTDAPIREAADVPAWKKKAGEFPRLLHLELLNRGVFTANRGLMNISTAMDEEGIDSVVEAFDGALGILKPYVEEHLPHLIVSGEV